MTLDEKIARTRAEADRLWLLAEAARGTKDAYGWAWGAMDHEVEWMILKEEKDAEERGLARPDAGQELHSVLPNCEEPRAAE